MADFLFDQGKNKIEGMPKNDINISFNKFIKSIDDYCKLPNIWNFGNISSNKALNQNNGRTLDNIEYDTTDFIPVNEGDIIYGYGARICCYDSNKTFLDITSVLNNQTHQFINGMFYYIIPNGVTYFRICGRKNVTPNQFQVGLSNPFEINQFNKCNSIALKQNLWNFGSISFGRSLSAQTGKESTNEDFNTTDFIPVNEGDIIYGYGARFCCYDSNKIFVSSASDVFNNLPDEFINNMHYYVIPSGISYFRICANKTVTPNQFQIGLTNSFELFLFNTKVDKNTIPTKLYCIGDSITRGMYTDIGDSSSKGPTQYNYPYWVGKINNYEVVNLGESGGGYANKGTQTNSNGKDIVDNNTFDNADIITIAFGVNDWKGDAQNITLGSMESESGDGSTIGNMKYMIETLFEKAPQANIIIMLPMNENRFSNGDFESNWGFGYAFRENKTLSDYRNAIRNCAEYYNLKVIDEEEVTAINRFNIRELLGDGLHPTLYFYKQMGRAFASLIN